MSTGEILTLLVSAAVSYTAFLFASAISKRIKASQASNTKKLKLGRTTLNVVSIAALWFFLTKLITSLFGVHPEKLSVEICSQSRGVWLFDQHFGRERLDCGCDNNPPRGSFQSAVRSAF